jgi:hypothetical protein
MKTSRAFWDTSAIVPLCFQQDASHQLSSRVSRRRASSLPLLGAKDDLLCREQLSIDLAFGRTQPD